MEGFSLPHILLLLVILLLLFGAKRLPEIGGALGKSIGEFKKSMRDVQNEMNTSLSELKRIEPPAAPPSQPQAKDSKPLN
jgi:sec-independent protein translocase protein TatA